MHRPRGFRHLGLLAAAGVAIVAIASAAAVIQPGRPGAETAATGRSPTPSFLAAAASSAAAPAATSPAAASVPVTLPAASPQPSAAPSGRGGAAIAPPLPGLLGAIGDSISQAFDAEALFENPSHSWVVGDDPGDGVLSIAERLRALGGAPLVVDAARSGARMADGIGQAQLVVAATRRLAAGSTALVTIELGGNDICRPSLAAMTSPAVFERQLRDTIAVLRTGAAAGGSGLAGLPRGSRLLLLSVPDAARLRQLTATVADAQRIYSTFDVCSTFLAPAASATALAAATARSAALNAVIGRVCAEIEAADGPSGRLHCRTDQANGLARSLSTTSFGLADVSPIDFFHPSLAGQAQIADGAWAAGYWASIPLPASQPSPAQPSPSGR